MKKVLLISASKWVGHISLLDAWKSVFMHLNYHVDILVPAFVVKFMEEEEKQNLYLLEDYKNLKEEYRYVVLVSPSLYNHTLIRQFHRYSYSKIIYVFHEPLDTLKNHMKVKNSISHLLFLLMVHLFQLVLIRQSDIIILPSQKSYNLYRERIYRYINKNYFLIPLFFKDQLSDKIDSENKIFFSYIGNITNDHGFDEYLNFVIQMINNNLLLSVKFKIATMKDLTAYQDKLSMIKQKDRIEIIQGKPMTNQELYVHFKDSFLVWNAYNRTNQSGILPFCYMFGTPVVFLKRNQNEFYLDNYSAFSIEDNNDIDELQKVVLKAYDNIAIFARNSRTAFNRLYNYKRYIVSIKSILA